MSDSMLDPLSAANGVRDNAADEHLENRLDERMDEQTEEWTVQTESRWSRLRMAIVAPEQIPVPPVRGGSVEITVYAMARQLAALHHDVTVFSRKHRRYPAREQLHGIQLERVATGSRAKYLANVINALAGRTFDVIQVENRPLFVQPIKRLFPQATVSLFLHSLTFVSPPKANKSAVREVLNAADLIVVNSGSLKQAMIKRYPQAAHKIRTAWLGVDAARFSPAYGKRPKRILTLLFAGRLIPRKGLPVLIRAIRRTPARRRIRLLVAGGSPRSSYARRMRRLARRLGVRAKFLGMVPHRRIHLVYRQADAFVCPSQKHEAFGLVNVEALASGLPVIASRIGGIGEIVQHGNNGYLVDHYRRPAAFAAAINKLVSSPALLQTMKRRARRDCVERFTWSAAAHRLARIYTPIRTAALDESETAQQQPE